MRLRWIVALLALASAACQRHVQGPVCRTDIECGDGLPCNGIEHCVAGACKPGTPPSCDDGVGCTADSCDDRIGCVHTPNDAACDDGIACTADTCSLQGCKNMPDDLLCDDGLFCNGVERCVAGQGCSAGVPPLDCKPPRSCETSMCDETSHTCLVRAIDADGDGHGAAPCGDDCDDSDPSVHPGAVDVCNNRDDNCDGWIDEDRIVGSRIDVSSSGGAQGGGWTLGLVASSNDTWTLSWPDVDCSAMGNAWDPSYAIEARASDGTPLAGSPRAWFVFPGKHWDNWGPSLARMPTGELLMTASLAVPQDGEIWLGSLSSGGATAVKQLVVSPVPPAARPFLAADAAGFLMQYVAFVGGVLHQFAVPLDAQGNRAGADVDLGPEGGLDVMDWGVAFDPTSGHFIHTYTRVLTGGVEVHVLLLDRSGNALADHVLPLPLSARSPHVVGTGSGYVALWLGIPGIYAMALGPGFEAQPPTQISPEAATSFWGVEVRDHEVAAMWNRTNNELMVTLVGFDAQRRAPDISLVPPNEWPEGNIAFRAGRSSFGLLYELNQTSPAGACASEPTDPHGKYAFRTLACP